MSRDDEILALIPGPRNRGIAGDELQRRAVAAGITPSHLWATLTTLERDGRIVWRSEDGIKRTEKDRVSAKEDKQ